MVLKNIEPKLVENKNNQAVTTSLQVAETFGKKHFNVVRDIENIISGGVFKNDDTQLFAKGQYKNPQNNQTYRMYYMNKDGFTLLAMGFTGKKAMQFKMEYINAFNTMQAKLSEHKPMSATERLKLATQSIGEIDDRVSNLENTMEITTDDQYRLRETGKNKVLNVLGGKNSNAYRKLSRKVFAQMWRDFKHNFYLPRYAALPKKQLNAGLNFVKTWQPDEVTSYAIQGLNNQTDLDV